MVVAQNYFTCTLGHALQRKKQGLEPADAPGTILEQLDEQARSNPDRPALGFANFKARVPASKAPDVVTYRELRRLSILAAHKLMEFIEPYDDPRQEAVVAMLCNSSMDFALTWLGLMRLGYAAILLAPQLEPPAIQHLCALFQLKFVFFDDSNAAKAGSVSDGVTIVKIPEFWDAGSPEAMAEALPAGRKTKTAYICHTSGTSSGLPSPIMQGQRDVSYILPHFAEDDQPATFSTTPMYHGGLADITRAWTSGAMVWLFPEGVAPITGTNLLSALAFARQKSTVPVKYFTSVPYILQVLAEETEGLEVLRDMDLVGVGGAALAPAVGDRLVQAGVNVLSRMGSAECGFLMSSHRDYLHDKEWQYLRPVEMSDLLTFEPRDGGLSELIVRRDWPFQYEPNLPDGSYATKDLFEPHPSIPNAWRYHSRADAQIALANGKKFDPSPIEATILASDKALKDVLIFGAGRDYPGILLFPVHDAGSEEALIASIWPTIEQMNSTTQSHARLSRSMLVVVLTGPHEQPLPKSSKGSILRRKAEQKYADVINSAYEAGSSSSDVSGPVADAELPAVVQKCFQRILSREIDPARDLFQQGVDSLSCIKVKKLIEAACVPENHRPLPLNVIYDQGTVNALCEHLLSLRHGDQVANDRHHGSELEFMKELAEKYSDFQVVRRASSDAKKNVVVLTGATGLLGAHILHHLRVSGNVDKVYCLLRGSTLEDATRRVRDALIERELPSLDRVSDCEIICLPCDLSRRDLGLSEEYQARLQEEAGTFIHAAWAVNFSLRLASFEEQIAGTRHLIDAAVRSNARMSFISSTAAVTSSRAEKIAESVSLDPSEASPLGYSQSKWVAERVCAAANEWTGPSTSGNAVNVPFISIIRVGQLCGNQAGVWNSSEAYPLMLSTASVTGCLPNLSQERLNWLPVELAARAVIEISQHNVSMNGNEVAMNDHQNQHTATPVYHVLNPHNTPTWEQLLRWIKQGDETSRFEIVPPTEWVERLEQAIATDAPEHPSQALLDLWKRSYGDESSGSSAVVPPFDMQKTREASPVIQDVKPLESERLLKIWRWVQRDINSR